MDGSAKSKNGVSSSSALAASSLPYPARLLTQPKPSKGLSDLRPYQRLAAEKMAATKQQAVLVPVGMGKTIITLTALEQLGVDRTLVVAPLEVAKSVWHAEAAKWAHTAHLHVARVLGTPRQRMTALQEDADIDVINYENLVWLAEHVNLRDRYDAIVFDELSKMKSPGTARFRAIRNAVKHVPIRFGLTGTPRGNHLLGLWGQLFMVAGDKPLGKSFTVFRQEYFRPIDPEGYVWRPLPWAEREIVRRIEPWAFHIPESEISDMLPEVVYTQVPFTPSPEAAEAYDRMTEELKYEDVEVWTKSALSNKLRQLSSGFLYDSTKAVRVTPEDKIAALRRIVEEQQGDPLLVFYWFVEELELLREAFPGVATSETPDWQARWNAGELPLLLLHPASAGHGLNLQGGGHTVVWFTLPWSLELWLQGIGRLRRIGQRSPVVSVLTLCGTAIDRHVASNLEQLKEAEEGLKEALCI